MIQVLVGCPIKDRQWIIKPWAESVSLSCEYAGVQPEFLFVGPPQEIEDTIKVVSEYGPVHVLLTDETNEYRRSWSKDAYAHMTALRNDLLLQVRKFAPLYYLSLDSDILLHHETLNNLLESVQQFDAVGGKTYMTPDGTNYCSYMKFFAVNGDVRTETKDVIDVDAIMAIKLMSPKAYNVDYVTNDRGEDIGWSIACTARGLKLGFDGRTANKHVMGREKLEVYDDRCGY